MTKEHEYIRDYFYGPVFEKTLLKPIAKTSITPNHLTISTFFLSILAATLILISTKVAFVFAGIVIIIRNGIDCLDGLLAREKNMSSEFGHKLDTCSDRFFEITLSLAILYLIHCLEGALSPYFLSLCFFFLTALLLRKTSGQTKHFIKNCSPKQQQILSALFTPLSFASRSILLRTTVLAVVLFINQLEVGFVVYIFLHNITGLKESVPYREWWIDP